VFFRVLAIGDGPAKDQFASDVPGLLFAGFQMGDDLGRAVASIDILLNPSVTETFGNVTLEAMAAGVPVVAANATGARTLVKDGITGRLVGPRDIAAYADAIAAYVTEPTLRQAAGKAGHQAAEAYEWDAVNQKVVDTYRQVGAGAR
jgi:glycosyltransferase involved in cell wall biosynthesis